MAGFIHFFVRNSRDVNIDDSNSYNPIPQGRRCKFTTYITVAKIIFPNLPREWSCFSLPTQSVINPALKNPNFKFNQSQFALKFSENYCPFSSSTINWKLRPRPWVFCTSGEDPPQSGFEDYEMNDLGVKTALSVLRFYKREISPLLPKSCRYVPTCSEYSMIAYKKYGFVKGTVLTAWRICRCNPLGGSGFDPPRWFDETTPPEQ